jgi:hypothetical protein
MATTTINYNLKKPSGTDIVDITDINGNMDIIDTKIKETIDAVGTTNQNVTESSNKIAILNGSGAVVEKVSKSVYDAFLTSNATSLADKSNKNDYVANTGYAVTAGTSTAYTITLNPAPTAYADGQQFIINPHVDCVTTPTLNVNELGAGTILKQDGTAISSGDIKANKPLSLVRVGSNFFIRSSGGNIKSIQRGETVLTATPMSIPIETVSLNVTIVRITVRANTTLSDDVEDFVIARLITANELRLEPYSEMDRVTVVWEIIEFGNVKSLQSGVKTYGTAVNSISISPVNPLKSLIFFTFKKGGAWTGNVRSWMYTSEFINASTISFKANAYYENIAWQVIEFN